LESHRTSKACKARNQQKLSLKKLKKSDPQRVLEHMAAHILYDSKFDHSHDPCGLCLRPAPICLIYLKMNRGAISVDMKRSTCINLVRFSYVDASRSSENSPCSNVPRICPLCPKDKPVVWTYNFPSHFRAQHNLTNQNHFPCNFPLSTSEKDGLKAIWDGRFRIRQVRKTKKPRHAPLMLSDAHSSRLALRYV